MRPLDINFVFEQVITKNIRILTFSSANSKVYAQSDVSDQKGFLFVEDGDKIKVGVFPGDDPEFGRKNLGEGKRSALDRSVFSGSWSLKGTEPRDHILEIKDAMAQLTSHTESDLRGLSGSVQFIQEKTHYTNTEGADTFQETWNAVLSLRVYLGKTGDKPYTLTPGIAGGYDAFKSILSGKTLPQETAEQIRAGTLGDFLINRAKSIKNGIKLYENLPIVLEGGAAAILARRIIESQIGFDKPSVRLETGPLDINLSSEAEFDGVKCAGSYKFDDEGIPFSGALSDIYSRTGAVEHNTKPTGNFRISPTHDSGKISLPHVITSPGNGFDLPSRYLLIKGIAATGGGDQITIGPAEAYLDGQAVGNVSFTTNAREILRNIAGIGDAKTLGHVKCYRGPDIFASDIGPALLLKQFSTTSEYIR